MPCGLKSASACSKFVRFWRMTYPRRRHRRLQRALYKAQAHILKQVPDEERHELEERGTEEVSLKPREPVAEICPPNCHRTVGSDARQALHEQALAQLIESFPRSLAARALRLAVASSLSICLLSRAPSPPLRLIVRPYVPRPTSQQQCREGSRCKGPFPEAGFDPIEEDSQAFCERAICMP